MAQQRPTSVPLEEATTSGEVLADGQRLDGRAFEEFRSAFFDCGTVSQAAGSGYAEFGGTKVLAAVYGPRQPERRSTSLDRGELDCDVRLASFAGRARKAPGQTDGERELSAQLSTALAGVVLLDRFPKAVLDVQCLVMEAGGGELAAAVAAAGLALADAGVAIRDLPSAAAVARVQGTLLLDPTRSEEAQEEAGLLLTFLPNLNQVSSLTCRGHWTRDQLQDAVELAMGGCEQIDEAMRSKLTECAPGPGAGVGEAAVPAAR